MQRMCRVLAYVSLHGVARVGDKVHKPVGLTKGRPWVL